MSDLLHNDFETVQSNKNALPNTLASAATIAPVHKFTRITGTTPITRITPPVSGYCEITLVFTTGGTVNALNTGGTNPGNIGVAYTSVADRPIDLCYDPRTGIWYPKAVV